MAEGLTEDDKQQLKQELVKVGIQTLRLAKQKAPVDTGRLRSSITIADSEGIIQDVGPEALPNDGVDPSDASGFSVVVGTNVEYADLIEFGAGQRRAQPFLRPAADQALRERNIEA